MNQKRIVDQVCHLFLSNFRFLLPCLVLLTACQPVKKVQRAPSKIEISDYRVFYDGQSDGYQTIGGTFFYLDGKLNGLFTGGPVGDYTTGKRPFWINSIDSGKTWSKPALFSENLLVNPKEWEKEALRLAIFGPTKKGTLIRYGDQFTEGSNGSGAFTDPQWRVNTLNIARRERRSETWVNKRYPTGTFLGEQFVAGGLQLPNGRIVFSIWGAKNKGENWRCGVLISDDDGLTWKYRDVAYEPALSIRDNPKVSAGFNEITLFRTAKGKLIAIIRGREKLGRLKDSPKDTWFFRSESTDNGETWSKYEPTNLAGTGATARGLTLPDGSLLQASRIPYSRTLYELPEPNLTGLHFSRSYDEGKTWQADKFIQRDPNGKPFTEHHNAMNGLFLQIKGNEWMYIFGQYDRKSEIYRILSCKVTVK